MIAKIIADPLIRQKGLMIFVDVVVAVRFLHAEQRRSPAFPGIDYYEIFQCANRKTWSSTRCYLNKLITILTTSNTTSQDALRLF